MGFSDDANWSNYPKEAPNIVVLDEDPSSRIREVVSLFLDISNLVTTAESITQLDSQSKEKNKRYFPKAMDIDEEDTIETPKGRRLKLKDNMSYI